MKALQLHYTSCRRGLSGSAGFQVRARSAGITPDEQREIERRGVYRPPRDAPAEASSEAIARDFPVALRFYTLESGRRALTRSCYSGRDYSGRWGNYFAHTLVFEGGSVPPLWPIDYYEWPCWQSRLEPEADTDQEPPPLPAVDLGEIEPAESFQLEEIAEFLREGPGRVELLARMGRAVLLGLEDSRAVVVRDTPTNNPYWIAGIQKLFPPQHAVKLSYSSYQEDPRGCAAVNATAGETDFTFGDPERRYQFYMFDLASGHHSEVPDADDYPAAAARWLAEDPMELDRFFEFMRMLEHRQIEPQLLSALHLFDLYRRRDRCLEGEELAAMIRFAARWARPEGRLELVETVAGAVERTGGLRQVEDYGRVIRFLAEGAVATGRPRHRELAHAVWLQLLDEHVVAHGSGFETAEACWRTLESTLSSNAREWAREMLEASRWNVWREHLPRIAPEGLVFLVRLTWRGLELLGRCPVWEQPEVAVLVQALVGGSGEPRRLTLMALEAVPGEAEALAAMSRLAGAARGGDSRSTRSAAGRALSQVLARVPADVATATRRMLDDAEGWELLFGEWLEICEAADDHRAEFGRYQQSVLAAVPGYGQSCLPWVANSLLDHLTESDGVSVALEWLSSNEVDRLSDELAGRCLELANRVVDLDPRNRDGDRTARLVAEQAVLRHVELRPDRPALRHALVELGKARTEKDLRLDVVGPALEGVDVAEYRFFLAAFLQPALELTGVKEEHRRVLRALLRAEQTTIFARAYRGFFRARRKVPWSSSLQAALKLWLWLDATKAGDRALAELETGALEELVRALSRLPTRSYEDVRKRIREQIKPQQRRVAARWRSIEATVADRQRGPLARLRGFLFRRSTA